MHSVLKLHKRAFMALLIIGLTGLGTSCQKRCQAPAEAPFETITATPWRLVKTSNTDVIPLNEGGNLISKFDGRLDFLIFEFTESPAAGEVRQVENNEELETPVLLIDIFRADPDTGELAIRYVSPIDGSTQVEIYDYDLDIELNLRERRTGFTYEFLPFTGVVPPDSNCTF